jgi:sterol desaturase/sphingolipid hydroxylase (fatty acid hydroxylase superfamily)
VAVLRPLIGLLVVAAVFGLIERLAPAEAPRRTLRDRWVDLPWWLLQPVAKEVSRGVVLVVVGLPLVALGLAGGDAVYAGFGPVGRLPLWVQLPTLLVVVDGVGYLTHRFWFHGPLWRWHAVHHAPEAVDWASALRVHPVNELVNRVVHAVPAVALGFDPAAVVGVVPLLAGWALVLHTDVAWSFGPLRHVVATPRFHRWHHARGAHCNFAGLFTWFDRLGGTLHAADRGPERLGVEEEVPQGLFAALAWPLRAAGSRSER